jgi:phage terminase large subunit
MTTPVGTENNPFIEFRRRYQNNAELFVREVLNFPNDDEKAEGKDLYPWQREALAAYDRAGLSRANSRISIRSGHGVGKTTLLAWMLWHRILFRFPQKTAVTAPSEKQLFGALWAEFETWQKRLPRALKGLVEIKSDVAELVAARSESFISIKTARAEQPEALSGLHAEWEMVIADEASGVADSVWEAAQSSLTGPHPLAILAGNPIRAQGFFHDSHNRLKADWWTRHVSRGELVDLETDPYALGEEHASGGRHTNRYRVRVLGEFPVSEDDVLIPFDLVEPALTRDVQVHRTVPVVWGLDCARFGSNRSALAKRQGLQLLEPVRSWAKLDTMEIAARVQREWDTTPDWLRPVGILVDAIGVGGGVADRLRQLGLPAKDINVSEIPALQNAEKYQDLRTELWHKAKEWFANRNCKLPESYKKAADGEDLVKELTQEKYDFQPRSGKIKMNPKTQVHSPDLADAFVLTFASEAAMLARSQDRTGKPVVRQLAHTW